MSRQKRSEAELQWRRERILEASARVFQRVGFSAATMEEIARESEYSPAALYNYFRNKEEIFLAAIEQTAERFVQTLSEPLPEGLGFEPTMRWRARRVAELAFESRGILMALEGQDGSPSLCGQAHRIQQCQRRTLEPWTALMAQGQREGHLTARLSAEQLAGAFIGLMRGAMITALTQADGPPLSELLELDNRLIDLFLDGARRHTP